MGNIIRIQPRRLPALSPAWKDRDTAVDLTTGKAGPVTAIHRASNGAPLRLSVLIDGTTITGLVCRFRKG
ncbi:MAG: hypothetical protein R8L07_03620 [Alphaproteobacteria bacterium]|nr:hypothetical protein [Alphaproteobacteria bacterium]